MPISGDGTSDPGLWAEPLTRGADRLDCGEVAHWSDCTGEVERRFIKDELLTTITIYWVTQTINSSTREISQPPREWAERFYNLRQWTEMPRGGHFAAFEEPQLLAQDIRPSSARSEARRRADGGDSTTTAECR